MTATLVPPPVTGVRRTGPAGLRGRVVGGLRDTPRRLAAILAGLVGLGLLVGVSAVVGVQQRAELVDDVRTRSGPLTVQPSSSTGHSRTPTPPPPARSCRAASNHRR